MREGKMIFLKQCSPGSKKTPGLAHRLRWPAATFRAFLLANLELDWETRSKGDLALLLNSLVPRRIVHQSPGLCPARNWRGSQAHTCGVPGVDDAQHLGVAVVFGLPQGPPELVHVQGPAVLLIQVIVHLDGTELRDDRRVEGVLRDGDHHPCP